MNISLIEFTPIAELPGSVTRYLDVGEKQHAVTFRKGALELLPPGKRHTVADVGAVFLNNIGTDWVAIVPSATQSLAITLRVNASDALADVTLLMQARATDPVSFVMWAARDAGSTKDVLPADYTTDDLCVAISDTIENLVNAVTRRYAWKELAGDEGRTAIYGAALSALKPLAANWGIAIDPAPGQITFVMPAVATIAKAQRLAEFNEQQANIAQEARMSDAQRAAAWEDFKLTLAGEDAVIGESVRAAVEVAAPTHIVQTAPPRQIGELQMMALEVGNALNARVQRELRKSANALTSKIGADVATLSASEVINEAPTPWWQVAIQVFKVIATLILLGSTLYFAIRQFNSATADQQVSYIREIVVSLLGLMIAIAGLPAVQKKLRQRFTRKPRIQDVWNITERRAYDGKVRTQVTRQLEQTLHSIKDAQQYLYMAGAHEQSLAVTQLLKRLQDLQARMARNEVGGAAYLEQEKPKPFELERMIAQDEVVLKQSQHMLDTAFEMQQMASQGTVLNAICQNLTTTTQELNYALGRRSDYFRPEPDTPKLTANSVS